MWSLENVGSVASTQQAARDRIEAARAGPFMLWSTEQQAGVGQHGRHWVHSGEALACSLAFPEPAADAEAFTGLWPLWVSLAAAQACETALELPPETIQLKWPNDLIWRGKKCGGVLVTRCQVKGVYWLIAGIGLNLRWLRAPQGFEASGLLEQSGRCWDPICRDRLLQALGEALAPLTERSPVRGVWQNAYAARDCLKGLELTLHHPVSKSVLAQGLACGIDDRGRLRLGSGQGMGEQGFAIGEASPRTTERVA